MSVTNRKLLLPIIALLVVASSLGLVASIPAAHAQGPFPGPCPVNSTPPPNSLPCLAISPQTRINLTPGSTVKFSVSTVNMPTFSGWDITIKTNNAVLNPLSLAVNETFGGTFQSTTNCINASGLGCSGNDGAGIAHSAGFSFGANDAGNVTLFTITFSVVGGSSTDIIYVSTPSEPSAVTDPSGFSLVSCADTPNQCLTGSGIVGKATPAVSTAVVAEGGFSFHDTATVTGVSGFTPTGTFVYSFFTNGGCTGSASSTETVALSGGNVPNSASTGPLSPGSYSYQGSYSGDTNYLAQSSTCEPFSVTLAPDFAVSVSPSTVNNLPTLSASGSTGSATVTVSAQNGFQGVVTLSTSVSPSSGLIAPLGKTSFIFNATNPTTQTTTLTLNGTSVGNYVVTVTGSSPGYSNHSATVNVQVVDFTISASPNPMGPVAAGGTASTTLTLTGENGFTETIDLSTIAIGPTATQPSPSTCSLSAAVTTCTATFSASADLPNNYEIDATGTGESTGASHTVAVTMIVNDFSVSANPTNIGPVASGSSGTSTITVTSENGFTGTVTLTLNSQPGLTATLSQYTFDFSSGPATQTATLTVSFSTPATYTVDVVGSSSGYITKTVTVTVSPEPTLFISPASHSTASPGSSLSYDVRVVGMPTFQGFDVSIQTDPAILNPVSVDTSGTMLPSPQVIVECINGAGTNCGASDGPGIVHVAIVSLGGQAAGDGLLFSITYTAVQGDFSIVADPNPFGPVAAGATGSTTITVTAMDATTSITVFNDVNTDPSGNSIPHATDNGSQTVSFSDTVDLSATPIGPTASLSATSPSPCTISSTGPVQSCTATLTASADLANTYEIDITGTSEASGNTHTIAVSFIVNDFGVSANPTSIGPLAANTDGTSTITVTAENGFTGMVTLTLNPQLGLTATLSQYTFDFSSGPATQTATLTVSFSTPATYTVDVTGTSSGYITKVVTVTVFPTATLFISPNSQSSGSPGTSLSYDVRVVGMPTFQGFDVSVRVNPALLNPTSVDLSGTMLPSPTVVVECINGSGTNCGASDGPGVVHLALVSLGGQAAGDGLLFAINYQVVAGPDFTLSASPSNIGPLSPGAMGSSTITIGNLFGTDVAIFNDVISDPSGNEIAHTTVSGTYGSSATVNLSVAGSAGLSASLSSNSVTLNTSDVSKTVTLTVNASSAGNYTATITATSGAITHMLAVPVVVTDFTVIASPTSFSNIAPGTNVNSTITVSAVNGFTGTVTLSTSAGTVTPSMITLTSSTSSGAATLTVSFSSAGNYVVTVNGNSPGFPARTATVNVQVVDFTVTASPTNVSPPNGVLTGTSTIMVSGVNGFTGTVTLTVSSSPGLNCTLSATSFNLDGSTTSGTSTLTCSAAAQGTYTAIVTGTSPGFPDEASHTAHVTFMFTTQDFSITASPNYIVAKTHPSRVTSTITVTSKGSFTGTVCLSATSSPSDGITLTLATPCVTVSAGGVAIDVLTIRIAHPAIVAAGTYTITVTGTTTVPGVGPHSTTITLVIPSSTSTGVSFTALTWTHTLSVSATGGTQTWTATVTNGMTTSQYVQIVVNGINTLGTHPFNAQSSIVLVGAGATVNITFSTAPGTFTAADIGQTFNFSAKCIFGSSSGSLNNVSKDLQSGSFTVTA